MYLKDLTWIKIDQELLIIITDDREKVKRMLVIECNSYPGRDNPPIRLKQRFTQL